MQKFSEYGNYGENNPPIKHVDMNVWHLHADIEAENERMSKKSLGLYENNDMTRPGDILHDC